MGKGSEWIATSENNSLGSCEAHHVGISPQENCGGTAGEVGERISPRTIRRQNESDSLSQGAEVDLSQQISRDVKPFRVERLAANWLTCPAIPVRGVALVAFFAMQIRMYPRTLDAFVLLGEFVRPLPIALSIPPQTRERETEARRRLGRGEGFTKIV